MVGYQCLLPLNEGNFSFGLLGVVVLRPRRIFHDSINRSTWTKKNIKTSTLNVQSLYDSRLQCYKTAFSCITSLVEIVVTVDRQNLDDRNAENGKIQMQTRPVIRQF